MKTNLTEAQLDRLPKYARSEIERLTRNVEYYAAKAHSAADENPNAIEVGRDGFLPEDTRLTFRLPGGRIEVWVSEAIGPKAIQLRRKDMGSLRVRPLDYGSVIVEPCSD